jgi:hypothetical protein
MMHSGEVEPHTVNIPQMEGSSHLARYRDYLNLLPPCPFVKTDVYVFHLLSIVMNDEELERKGFRKFNESVFGYKTI